MDFILPIVLIGLLVVMMVTTRNRNKRMQAEREAKQAQMLPGVEVLLQGGLYGTVVEFDSEDLSKPALIELAPGMNVKVHSQAVLRIVEDEVDAVDKDEADELDPEVEVPDDASAIAPAVETVEETRLRLEADQDKKNED